MELSVKLSLDELQDAQNICDLLTDEDLREIGAEVKRTYDVDEGSRKRWVTKMEDATELALQLT